LLTFTFNSYECLVKIIMINKIYFLYIWWNLKLIFKSVIEQMKIILYKRLKLVNWTILLAIKIKSVEAIKVMANKIIVL